MKNFFSEFKKFITRGNVVDMAVGVIVGSSFTAIVNALSNNILKPVINYLIAMIFGADSLSECFTFLTKVNDAEGNVDLTQSIYIDWGAFINAIINFLLIALVLFTFVRIINKVRDGHEKRMAAGKNTKEDIKAMKAQGIKRSDKEAVKAYYAAKAEAEEKAKAEAEEKARLDRLANPTTEDLLKQIIAIMGENQ